jgi:ABC-type glycerol-3-phosphate transport system permease component
MKTTPTDREIRIFGLTLAGILGAMAAWQLWRHRPVAGEILLGTALAVLAGLAWPPALRPVHAALIKIGAVLGWLNTRLILILVYYLIFTPAALVMRLAGRDPLSRRLDRKAESYWIPRGGAPQTRDRYEKMY